MKPEFRPKYVIPGAHILKSGEIQDRLDWDENVGRNGLEYPFFRTFLLLFSIFTIVRKSCIVKRIGEVSVLI
jgi:hypothetical protein